MTFLLHPSLVSDSRRDDHSHKRCREHAYRADMIGMCIDDSGRKMFVLGDDMLRGVVDVTTRRSGAEGGVRAQMA